MLCYRATNANTFEFEAFNLSGQLVFQSAGAAADNNERTYVWDGTGSVPGWYDCRITFRNNCAKELYNGYQVYSSGSPNKMGLPSNTENEAIDKKGEHNNNSTKLQDLSEDENSINLVPNPNNGKFRLITVFNNYEVEIFNSYGNLIYKKSCYSPTIEFDLSRFSNGTYFMRLTANSKVFTKIIVKQ